jgi:hypothetical protein
MDRPVFIIYLQPPSSIDDMRALKALLKTALRRHRLKCIRLTTYDPLELEQSLQDDVAGARSHTRGGSNAAR